MYDNISQAIDDLKSKGYEMITLSEDGMIRHQKLEIDPKDLRLTRTLRFTLETSASEEATLYVLETDNYRGFITVGAGWQLDPLKAKLLDRLKTKSAHL